MTTTSTVASGAVTYDLDPMHSGAHFAIRHLMIASVRGQFTGLAGTLVLDKTQPANSHVDITIDINSIQTGQVARDEHLKAADFFDVAQYPTMTFRSQSISPIEDGHAHIVGDLTLHGVTQQVTLDTTGSSDEVKDMWGGQRVGFTAQTKINRSDFGMSWNAPLETGGVVLSEEVLVTLEVEFKRTS